MTILRKTLSVLAGTLAGGLCIAVVEATAHSVSGVQAAFAAAIAGYGLGALAGSAVAARFADRTSAAIVTGILSALAAVNLFAFPHPIWFAPAAVVSLLLGCAIGIRIARGPSDGALRLP